MQAGDAKWDAVKGTSCNPFPAPRPHACLSCSSSRLDRHNYSQNSRCQSYSRCRRRCHVRHVPQLALPMQCKGLRYVRFCSAKVFLRRYRLGKEMRQWWPNHRESEHPRSLL